MHISPVLDSETSRVDVLGNGGFFEVAHNLSRVQKRQALGIDKDIGAAEALVGHGAERVVGLVINIDVRMMFENLKGFIIKTNNRHASLSDLNEGDISFFDFSRRFSIGGMRLPVFLQIFLRPYHLALLRLHHSKYQHCNYHMGPHFDRSLHVEQSLPRPLFVLGLIRSTVIFYVFPMDKSSRTFP